MIEPHDVTTVSRRPPVAMDKARTWEDYMANLKARFPECVTSEGLANPVALARRENRARIGLNPQSTMARPQVIHGRSPEAEAARIAAIQKTMAAKASTTRQRILLALSGPRTTNDIAAELGMTRFHITGNLSQLLAEGRVTKMQLKRVTIWQRAAE